MKFRINRAEPMITWPEKCVWCGGKPTLKFEDSGTGFVGSGFYRRTRGKVVVYYPLCKRHGLWLSVLQSVYPISIYAVILSWWIHYSLFCLLLGAIFFWNLFVRPVRIKKITKDFYTLKIRKRDYAREFALLNSLDPL